MRPTYLLVTGAMLGALSAGAASAQSNPPSTAAAKPGAAATAKPAAPAASAAIPSTRIAFVNTEAFGDEKVGISRYVAGLKAVELEFQPRQNELVALQSRITSISEEVAKLNADRAAAATVQSKVDEGQKLQVDLKRLTEDAQAAFRKRSEEVMTPIMQDIGKSLEQFAVQRNITMLLDISKMASAILTLNPTADVTQAFIADYNRRNPVAAAK